MCQTGVEISRQVGALPQSLQGLVCHHVGLLQLQSRRRRPGPCGVLQRLSTNLWPASLRHGDRPVSGRDEKLIHRHVPLRSLVRPDVGEPATHAHY